MVPDPGENGKSHLREPVHIPSIQLERDSARPLHRQISEQIAASIRTGAMHPGARLPSTRLLATYLEVSRNTVLTAYDELASQGSIESQHGSGVYVCGMQTRPRNIEAIAKAAYFPQRRIEVEDLDGNSIAMNY
jgi:GntR family transcriptional regulator/MocR family aminotransferase